MKLRILMERPTENYERSTFVRDFYVSDFKIERGALFLYRRGGWLGQKKIWRVFNVTEWSEIAIDDDAMVLGPRSKPTIVPITDEGA